MPNGGAPKAETNSRAKPDMQDSIAKRECIINQQWAGKEKADAGATRGEACGSSLMDKTAM